MTHAVFTVKDDRIIRVECQGHTGYAPSGEDIVCAAVSSILQAAVLGVMQVAKAKVHYRTDPRKGWLEISIQDGQDASVLHDVHVILETALVGLQDLAASYSQFVKVEVKRL